MPMNPIVPALRTFRNKSNDLAKIELRVPTNHELVVTDEVAGQLDARVFLEVGVASAEAPAPAPAETVESEAPAEDEPKAKGRRRA